MLENSSRPRLVFGAKKPAEGVVITVPVHCVYFAVYHRMSLVCVLQTCVLFRHKRDGLKHQMYARKMYNNIRQVRVLQILYNKAVCTFVILWKNTKFQMLVHKD